MNPTNDKHSHAMRREIYEQPQAIAKTIAKHLKDDVIFPGELHAIESALLTFEKLIIAASGSSRHAGLAGEIMIEISPALRSTSSTRASIAIAQRTRPSNRSLW